MLDPPVTLQHARQIIENGEWTFLIDLLEDVHSVRGQDHPAARRVHTQNRLPARMATDEQILNTRCQCDIAPMENHASGVDEVDEGLDIFSVIGRPKSGMRHIASSDVDHLLVLDVEAGFRIVFERADMVEMGMRQYYVGLSGSIDSISRNFFGKS